MRKKILFVAILSCVVLSLLKIGYAEEETKISAEERRNLFRELRPEYKDWFNMVTYLATDEEKNVFLLLKNDKDRNIFIHTFWLQRDPTPGTPTNEYKEEIEKRFRYVNKEFKKGSSKPGWMTDMGKFHMILGEPNSIDRYESKPGLFPAQVWYYHGDKRLGLPTYFNVTFFRPNNTTEWKLYSPAHDGPAALLIHMEAYDFDDQTALYEKIKELAPGLAMPSLTMIPNEYSLSAGPNMRSNLVLSNIYDSPKKSINVSYATNFLKYKGFVDVDTSVNFIENSNMVSVTKYERFGFNFVNISLKPKKISVAYNTEKDKYFFNFEFTVSLKQDDEFIYQYTKNFDFYVEPDKVNALKGNGVVIHDSFPAIPGNYTVMVFAKNSVGKEFTFFEKKIQIAPPGTMPLLATPVIGYKIETQEGNFLYPYKVSQKKLFVDTDGTFKLNETPYVLIGVYNLNQELWNNGHVQLSLHGLSDRVKFNKKFTIRLHDQEFKENMNILFKLSEEGLYSDYYELNMQLINQHGIVLDTKGAEFTISPFKNIGYPMETFKRMRLDNPYYFYFIIAQQYETAGNGDEAEKYYEQCVQNKPEFYEGYARYLNLLNRQKKYTKVLVEVENLKPSKDFEFEYYLIKGTALYGMNDFEKALDELMKANEKYDSDIRVLNLLGFTFLNLNNYKEALKAFDASLNLDKKQPYIIQTVSQVKEKIGIK